ncbi:hypothetical protein M5K25_024276 [Dendrobium thyrsiflorum]|uniref:Uncharacterized protein n=1 Tax=Dendrobium thyrsiflorum TaxID=117978 RepID=A0ABD0U1Q4_DENTH
MTGRGEARRLGESGRDATEGGNGGREWMFGWLAKSRLEPRSDQHRRVDVLHSPFFDVAFGNDATADEYVERILYQLTLAIEDQLPANRWCLVSRRPSSPNPATSPTTSTRGIPLLLVASLLVASLLLRPFA